MTYLVTLSWDELVIFCSVLVFLWLIYFFGSYLSYRQRKIYKTCLSVPEELKEVLPKETFEKSRLYSLDKSSFDFWQKLYSQLESTIILCLGAIPFVWNLSTNILKSWDFTDDYEITISLLTLLIFVAYSTVTEQPWSIYSTFVLEEKHGFNKQTVGFYIKDQIKGLIVGLVIGLPLTAALLWIIKIGGDYFFIYAWIFLTVISFILMTVYPEFIAPLFDKYTPLEEGPLRSEIEALAESIEFPLKKLYVVEGSKRSSHSNAYFYGLWKNKRIVLYDTLIAGYKVSSVESEKVSNDLTENEATEEVKNDSTQPEEMTDTHDETVTDSLPETSTSGEKTLPYGLRSPSNVGTRSSAGDNELTIDDQSKKDETKDSEQKKGCSNDEVLAVLGHEFGHWKMNHNLFNIVISLTNTFLCLAVFALLMKKQILYTAFGFPPDKDGNPNQPVLIGLLVIFQFIFSPYLTLLAFILTCISRRFEFQADKYSSDLRPSFNALLRSALIKLHIDNLGFPVSDWLLSMVTFSHPPLLERLKVLEKLEEEKNHEKEE